MKRWVSTDDCTGCGACVNSCPNNAISMSLDSENGFSYPSVDNSLCSYCLHCYSSCPVINTDNLKRSNPESNLKIFAAWAKDDDIRFKSTSGGIFSIFAEEIISQHGVVFGAGFNSNLDVIHFPVTNMDELDGLRRSKYVQSEIGTTYCDVRDYLNRGVLVLFCGTPCQIAGLRTFLRHEYSNLYTLEFICLGVNSPLVYRKWIEELEISQNSKIRFIWFKYKKYGWRNSPFCTLVEFADGTQVILDEKNNYFMKGFLEGNYYVRPSCSKCRFMGKSRVADITVGDYWSVEGFDDDGKGTSVAMLNTLKSESLFNEIKNKINFRQVDFISVYESNPRFDTPISYNPLSKQFLKNINNNPFSEVVQHYVNDKDMPDILAKIKKQ